MFAYGLAPFPSVHPSAKASTTLVACPRDIKKTNLESTNPDFLHENMCFFFLISYSCSFVK